MNHEAEESQLGLHLPDEPYNFPISLRGDRCPLCGGPVQIFRAKAFQYSVTCFRRDCDFKTAVHRYSEQAVREFRVTALLHRP